MTNSHLNVQAAYQLGFHFQRVGCRVWCDGWVGDWWSSPALSQHGRPRPNHKALSTRRCATSPSGHQMDRQVTAATSPHGPPQCCPSRLSVAQPGLCMFAKRSLVPTSCCWGTRRPVLTRITLLPTLCQYSILDLGSEKLQNLSDYIIGISRRHEVYISAVRLKHLPLLWCIQGKYIQ